MAQLEHAAGISSTFFVLVDGQFYDPLQTEVVRQIREIHSLGHEILRSGVRVHSRVAIGDDSIFGANTVVGHQGFGFVRDELGHKTRIPHLGGVVIGSHVEIGALVTVPSGTIGPTIIENRVKIDDHVHVGHNARVARGASLTAAVTIAGSALIDEEAWLGINSSVRDGRRVGYRAFVGMDVSVQQDLADFSVARAPRPDIKVRSDDTVTHEKIAESPNVFNKLRGG